MYFLFTNVQTTHFYSPKSVQLTERQHWRHNKANNSGDTELNYLAQKQFYTQWSLVCVSGSGANPTDFYFPSLFIPLIIN